METLLQDIRYALRGLRRTPSFAVVALLTLALGIGVNSSIFSVVNAILFKPLPVQHPEQLVDIYGHAATSSDHETSSYPNFLSYREQTQTLSELVGYSNFFAHLSLNNSDELVIGELVTDRYFQALGISLFKGRPFSADEYSTPGANPVAVISFRMWQNRFAGADDVVGRTFRMNGLVYTVIGVAPREFGGMMPAVTSKMWIPTAMAEHVEPMGNNRTSGSVVGATRLDRRGQHWMWLKGRMKPGVTPAQVRTEFEALAARLGADFPASNAQERVFVVPTTDVRINPDFDKVLRPVGIVLLAAVGLVLIVACANLANLLLARAAGRRREIAVRLAIGASRRRLVRQLLTESMLLAVAGGAIAIPIAFGFSALVAKVRPPLPMDFGFQVAPDWRVLFFTLVVAVLTGIVFGLVPAMRATRPDLVPALRGMSGDGRRKRVELRDALVVLQVAVSLILVVGGALLVRSLAVAGKVDLGYNSDRVAQVALALEMNGYNAYQGGQLIAAAQQKLAALPGVQAVSVASRIPLSLNNNGFSVYVDGKQTSASDRPFGIDGAYVDENYVRVLDLKVVAGRNIEAADRDGTRHVAVISSAMAQRFWPGAAENAVGREFRLRWGGEPYRVIGVVADYKVNSPGENSTSYIHLPLSHKELFANFLVKTTGNAAPMVPTFERALRSLNPELVFLDRGTLRELADIRLFPVRAGAWLIGSFGLLALAVAAIGLYGVIGYSVSRRVHEIGIRKALGAQSRQLVGMVLREGMVLVAVGGVLGAALSVAAAQVLSSVLYVGPFDPVSFAVAFTVLGLVALLANALPARRAAMVDPMVALRQQ